MVQLSAIGNVSATFGTKKSLKPVTAASNMSEKLAGDTFSPAEKKPAKSKNLIGKFIGAMSGYFAANQINNTVNKKLMTGLNIDKQKTIMYLKAAIIVINAVIAILTMLSGSEVGGKIQNFVAKAFTDKK